MAYDSEFSDLQGKTIAEMHVLKSTSGDDRITFKCTDGTEYLMHHYQDCCEHVYIEDIVGDTIDLVGTPILLAEEVTNQETPPDGDWDESYTWTFYKLSTIKGSVTIRWYGSSNGYYSESVDFSRTS